MADKNAIFSTILRESEGRLVYLNPAHEVMYKTFVGALEKGHLVEVFFDANMDDGTLAQIAKIKACIRELAKETGNTFEDTQLEIKKATGLCVIKTIEGEKYMVCKSFGDCSKSDLSLAIQTIIERGKFLGINFH